MDANTVLILAVLFVVIVNGIFQAMTLRAIIRTQVDIHTTTRDIHETTRHTLELVFQQSQARGGA